MKVKTFFFMVLVLAILASCKKDEDSTPETLGIVTEKIQLSLDSINTALESAAVSLAAVSADTGAVRTKLQQLYSNSAYAKEVAFINSGGILLQIEPPAYYPFQGSDFSNDSDMMGVIQNHQSVFTAHFDAIEGFGAVADIHSIYSGTNSYGAIEVLIAPWGFLNSIIKPLVSAPKEIFVMEKNGNVIYDVDLQDSAKNVFTDPYYATFTEFKEACQTIIAEDSGEITYTFYLVGTTTPVSKRAWWKTIKLHDNSWKVVWTEEK
jgi:branched-chain amino acid transport system substrate-binding protein